MGKNSERTAYLDYLRLLALFAVVIVHLSGQNWNSVGADTASWQAFNFYGGISRFCVPAFVMISGALFLGRDIPLRKLYGKYVLRRAVAFVFWTIVYAVAACILSGNIGIRDLLYYSLEGHYHLWFLPMIIGLYILTPLLRQIAMNEKAEHYFLFFAFVFAFFIPQLLQVFRDFTSGGFLDAVNAFGNIYDNMHPDLFLGYAGYFVLGHCISRTSINKKQRTIIYILGAAGFIISMLLNLFGSMKTGENVSRYYSYLTATVFLESLAVFVLFMSLPLAGKKLSPLLAALSKYGFGAYLVHALIIELLEMLFGFDSLSFTPWLSVPVISLAVLAVSLGISWVLNKIPFVNKYLV